MEILRIKLYVYPDGSPSCRVDKSAGFLPLIPWSQLRN